jgi:hypothetical protein
MGSLTGALLEPAHQADGSHTLSEVGDGLGQLEDGQVRRAVVGWVVVGVHRDVPHSPAVLLFPVPEVHRACDVDVRLALSTPQPEMSWFASVKDFVKGSWPSYLDPSTLNAQ